MKERIILFTIASVQNFIIASRKTRDLLNSSIILSDLIKCGIDYLLEEYKGELILPKGENENQIIEKSRNYPNYFIVKYESNKCIGDELEKSVREKYKGYFKERQSKIDNESYKKLEAYFKKAEEEINKQINSELDCYWVDCELEDGFDLRGDSYKNVYKKLYRYLEATKNVKKFNKTSETGKKCSICGKRNLIFIKEISGKDRLYPQNNVISLQDNIVSEKEELCSVCFLKRIFKGNEKEEKKVPSLPCIALSAIKDDEYKDENGKNSFGDYKKFIDEVIDNNKEVYDKYQAMYIENWSKVKEKLDVDSLKLFEESEKDFEHIAKNLPRYYFIYRMDIDNLGKWMSGKYKEEEEKLYQYQAQLSKRINDFFDRVRGLFEDNFKGELIYAGGDDLLAILPVRELFRFAKEIKKIFSEKVKDDGAYKEITYTQGIFLAHYKSPLEGVLKSSREQLELCKERFKKKNHDYDTQKDGTVISIMTEGYSGRSLYLKNYIHDEFWTDYIKEILSYFREDSTYFHDELEMEFLGLQEGLEDYSEANLFLKMLTIEQKRIMKRHKKETVKMDRVEEVSNKLIAFINRNVIIEDNFDLENYFNLFHIIRKVDKLNGGKAYEF